MNLFVAAMLTLVLADNLLLLYLGWEGVGLCSYLLIGFWYREPNMDRRAEGLYRHSHRRHGLAIILHPLYSTAQLVDPTSPDPAAEAGRSDRPGGHCGTLLLIGAVGKSAQLPLQVWLPDAMAGPTPVSALIHAATMVTAGVYLIARMHQLVALAMVQETVAVIGLLTLLLAACSALVQRDMAGARLFDHEPDRLYVSCTGVGAWSAALFHFLTHSCFKPALLSGWIRQP